MPVFFEAAVAGGIPIIKAIREAFIGNHIQSIHGIINGTSNYILTRMAESGQSFADALAEAQAAGYAEADPTLDVNGWDAAHKAVILASLAYGFWVPQDKIFVEGIEHITADDIALPKTRLPHQAARRSSKPTTSGEIEVRVHPTLIPEKHVLASASTACSTPLAVHGDIVGDTLFYGRGAGQDPTSSAVIADIAEAADRASSRRGSNYGFMPHGLYGTCKPIDQIVSRVLPAPRRRGPPGRLAQVAGILGAHNIGISSIFQPETQRRRTVPLVLVIHKATQRPDRPPRSKKSPRSPA